MPHGKNVPRRGRCPQPKAEKPGGGGSDTIDTSVGDALRAIRVVRSRAAEWGIDPRRVGIMGFSAGGAVTALAAAQDVAPSPEAADTVDRQNSRPDFQILVHPGGSFVTELRVAPGAPPAFLACAYDDQGSAALVAQLFLKFKEAAVPAELHIYARGGHGFGLRENPLPVGTWTARVQDWMAGQNFLRKP